MVGEGSLLFYDHLTYLDGAQGLIAMQILSFTKRKEFLVPGGKGEKTS